MDHRKSCVLCINCTSPKFTQLGAELIAEKKFFRPQVIRDCLTKGIEDASEGDDPLADVIYVHDDLYDSGNEGIDDKLWS